MRQEVENNSNVHSLKINPIYLQAIDSGIKTFEIRKDDRDYQVDDILLLKGYDNGIDEYTNSVMSVKIVGIFGREEHEKEYVKLDYVILSIKKE